MHNWSFCDLKMKDFWIKAVIISQGSATETKLEKSGRFMCTCSHKIAEAPPVALYTLWKEFRAHWKSSQYSSSHFAGFSDFLLKSKQSCWHKTKIGKSALQMQLKTKSPSHLWTIWHQNFKIPPSKTNRLFLLSKIINSYGWEISNWEKFHWI